MLCTVYYCHNGLAEFTNKYNERQRDEDANTPRREASTGAGA
jgi:hypothetical protein